MKLTEHLRPALFFLLPFALLSTAFERPVVAVAPVRTVTLHLALGASVPISPTLYGVNYDWNAIPSTMTQQFARTMHVTAEVHTVRYPGGWNAEHYDWLNNKEQQWRHYSPIQGASPAQILHDFSGVTFITPSLSAITNPSMDERVATISEALVKQYGDRVKVWEIGNEWFLQRGAKHNRQILQQNIDRYAELLDVVVPRMKRANPRIRIYVAAEWNDKSDTLRLHRLTDPGVWAQIDGIAIHPYCGMTPDESSCTTLQQRIADVRSATGKQNIYASEWAVVRSHTDDDFGIRNANFTLIAIRNLTMARVKYAAYWPPAREIPALSFVSRSLDQPYATGIVFGWMSHYYEGAALTVTGDSDAAAADDHGNVTIFVPSAEQGPERVRIELNGTHLHHIVVSRVLSSGEPNDIHVSWRAHESPLPVTPTQDPHGGRYAEFILDPGTEGRGSAYEIARVTLR